jgi:NADH-quinone oxidoreductase subunit L
MVTAGVFIICRAHVFVDLSALSGSLHAGTVISWIGAITALGAATVAVKQNDMKRVLAYSTLSQLGYMFIAVGVGAYSAAIFHMVTHAFFKALLFLGSGSVIHGLHDEQDMRKMGGLRKYMPITAMTFVVGWLAIAGIFPFAGFWSKDEILAKAWAHHSYALWAVGVVAALFTAFYMTRQVWLVFFGPERFREGAHTEAESTEAHAAAELHEPEPHESPVTMLLPLVALAALSIVGGFLSLPFTNPSLEFLATWLEPAFHGAPPIEISSFGVGFALSTLALVIAVVGIVVGRAVYRNGLTPAGDDPIDERLGSVSKVLANAYYFDAGIARVVGGPVTAFARFLAEGFDRKIIDGAVNGVGSVFRSGASALRTLQTGLVRNYALGIAAGAVVLLVCFLVRVSF